MQQTSVAEAFNAHLATLPNAPRIVWENQDADVAPPYLQVEHIRSQPSRYTLDGWHEYTGRMQVTVVVPAGTYTAQANALAEAVAAHFAADTSIPVGDGVIRIPEAPWIVDGLQDGARYRIPVQVRYRFLA